MAFGTVPASTANRVWVGTTQGAVNVPVGGLQGYQYGGTAETSEEAFYNAFPSITTVGEPVRQAQLSGLWNDGDSGLAIVKAAFETQAEIFFAVAPNGTDGEGLPCRVSDFQSHGGGVETAAGYSFTLVQTNAPFDIAGGLV